jgi:hypothetical protein
MQVSVTRASEAEQRNIGDLLAGSILEGCVTFGRSDYPGMLQQLCRRHSAAAGTHGPKQHGASSSSAAPGAPPGFAPVPRSAAGIHSDVEAQQQQQRRPEFAAAKVLGIYFCGHPAIAAELEAAVEGYAAGVGQLPGAPLLMYGSETVFG